MRTDVIIVGSGIIGMSLALSLSMKKKKVILVEKNFFNNLRVNRIYAISEKTKIFFENIDIWDNTENINTLSGMNLFYRKFNQENLLSLAKKDSCSNIGYIVQSKDIMSALKKKVEKDQNISLLDNSEIKSLDESRGKVTAETSNNKKIESEYLFSCEGINSSMKKKLSISNIYDNYNSKALVFNIDHTARNNNIAYQIFLKSGPIAFLPISENSFSMVVSIKNRYIDEEKFDKDNICEYLKNITNNKFGEIKLSTKLISFDLIGFDSEKYKHGKILFVGDSAHSVHPLAGMGLNLGISDIIELDRVMKENKNNFENNNYFSGYARKQRIINKKARQQLKFIEKIYSIENKFLNKFILSSMAKIQKSQFAKEKIIKHANNNLSFF